MSTLCTVARGGRLSNPLLGPFLIGAALLIVFPTAVVRAQSLTQASQWPMGGHDLSNTGSQSFTTIGVSNVNQLTSKWVFTTAAGSVSATPAVINGEVYFPDWRPFGPDGTPVPGTDGYFYAVDAITGHLNWSHRISDWTGVPGDFARDDPAFSRNKIILGDQGGQLATFSTSGLTGPGARVIEVNAENGSVIWVTQVDSFPAAIITGSPVVFNGVVYVGVSSNEEYLASNPYYPCCSFQGSVVALDQGSGQILWKTPTVPTSLSNPGGYTGGAVWDSTPVVDATRGSLYVGTGNNYTVPSDVTACITSAMLITNATLNDLSDSICNGIDNYAQDYFDSVLALDLQTGAIKWARRVEGYDAYTYACQPPGAPGVTWCPSPLGPDYDFGGAGPNFFTTTVNGISQDVVGAGQKSGIYWAFNPDNGNRLWSTLVGPGSFMGGIQWGTATDGQRIYVPIADAAKLTYRLKPSGRSANGGSWAALDTTGTILWQTATPGTCQSPIEPLGGCMALGPATVGNGVVYSGSMDANPSDSTMFALNAATGQILWSFAAGSQVIAAPAIVGNSLYWGSGYRFGSSNNKLYAFALPGS